MMTDPRLVAAERIRRGDLLEIAHTERDGDGSPVVVVVRRYTGTNTYGDDPARLPYGMATADAVSGAEVERVPVCPLPKLPTVVLDSDGKVRIANGPREGEAIGVLARPPLNAAG